MQKIYVLLRGDQQTGPYSLQEIIQFDLKPYDLIWIEGKSAGWYYPQEIADLHPYLSFMRPQPEAAKPSAAKTIHVAMPATPKAEEPKREPPGLEPEAFSLNIPEKPLSNFDEDFYTKFTKTTENKTESFTGTTAPAKPKKQSSVSVGGAIAAVLIIGGVFAASWIMSSGAQKEETISSGEASQASQVQNEIASIPDEKDHSASNRTFFPKNSPSKESFSKRSSTSPTKQTVQKEEEQDFTADYLPNETGNNSTAVPASEDEQTSVENSTSTTEEKEAPQEKKKKLRDKILDIFKKGPEEKPEAKRAEEENGERRPVYREGGANLAQQVSIRLTIPNDWMMGIKGAKATLFNKSNVTIAKAIVDVHYYDDENELLQKKTITFSRIDGKETQTLSIPDHSTATKVEYTIISVEGKPAA